MQKYKKMRVGSLYKEQLQKAGTNVSLKPGEQILLVAKCQCTTPVSTLLDMTRAYFFDMSEPFSSLVSTKPPSGADENKDRFVELLGLWKGKTYLYIFLQTPSSPPDISVIADAGEGHGWVTVLSPGSMKRSQRCTKGGICSRTKQLKYSFPLVARFCLLSNEANRNNIYTKVSFTAATSPDQVDTTHKFLF